jgi:hypothetical protein
MVVDLSVIDASHVCRKAVPVEVSNQAPYPPQPSNMPHGASNHNAQVNAGQGVASRRRSARPALESDAAMLANRSQPNPPARTRHSNRPP